MHVEVNAARLWFDVEGPGLVWDGTEHRLRPTVVLVHGGPGSFDHSYSRRSTPSSRNSPRSRAVRPTGTTVTARPIGIDRLIDRPHQIGIGRERA